MWPGPLTVDVESANSRIRIKHIAAWVSKQKSSAIQNEAAGASLFLMLFRYNYPEQIT
jgi:hypothetical protein